MSNKIISVAYTSHDHNIYYNNTHIQYERFTRRKMNLNFDEQDIGYNEFRNIIHADKLVAFSYNEGERICYELPFEQQFHKPIFFKPTNLWERIKENNLYYIEHHQAHATYAYLMSNFEESDILTLDGGAMAYEGMFIDKYFNINDLTNEQNIGKFWQLISSYATYKRRPIIMPGKLMGLVAYGKFNKEVYEKFIKWSNVEIHNEECINKFISTFYNETKNILIEDIAYTLQQFSNDALINIIKKYKTSDNICVSGGVAYNGYMNELLTKYYHNVFVPPAVGDEGISLGCYMHADYVLNDNRHIPELYAGLNYKVED
jgi:predicted NodU family carbamoyl transferase